LGVKRFTTKLLKEERRPIWKKPIHLENLRDLVQRMVTPKSGEEVKGGTNCGFFSDVLKGGVKLLWIGSFEV